MTKKQYNKYMTKYYRYAYLRYILTKVSYGRKI